MRLLYYKPVLNPAVTMPGYDTGLKEILTAFISLADGERTADGIVGILLQKGYHISDIIEVFNDLHRRKVIQETNGPNSRLLAGNQTRSPEKQIA